MRFLPARVLVLFALLVLLAPSFGGAYAQATPGSSLTVEALDNATYRPIAVDVFGPSIQFKNGTYNTPPPQALGISQSYYGYGDLNGDGQEDAVAIVAENLSGVAAGLKLGLAAYLNDSGAPHFVDAIALGGPMAFDSVTVDSGIITLVGLQMGPQDAFCCPKQPFTKQFKLASTKLVPASGPVPTSGAAPAPTPPSDAASVPDTLTDPVQADILQAITRANNAWARAKESLDSATLNGNVAGQALSDDVAEVDNLRAQGQLERNHETAHTVVDVSLDAPGHAVVHTHETWFAEIYESTTRRLVQTTTPASYDETYIIEYQNGTWIVTTNDLH